MYMKALLGVTIIIVLYLWRVSRVLHTTPDEALNLCEPLWTEDEIKKAYRKLESQPINVRPYLFDRTNRRYVVVGGSGLVGAWIVQHLLMRGEDPAAIRIVDLAPIKRKEILEKNIHFVRTDISDIANVLDAFQAPWPDHVKSLPLTVFHCAAYISVTERTPDLDTVFQKINIQGTANIIKASQTVGASILVSTSSGSTGLLPPSLLPLPWQSLPNNYWQLRPNGDRDPLIRPLEEYSGCYAWSKARAEDLVRKANNPSSNFRTGVIRPCQTLYGPGGANKWSISYSYLSRGGSPSWIHDLVVNLVHAENVSIGHLAFENALLKSNEHSGKSYAVTDPNPPVTYGHFYKGLSTLAHPLTPVSFPAVPPVPMVLMAYAIEIYVTLRRRIPLLSILPDITGDIRTIQPAMLRACQLHTVFTDDLAQREIGYRAPISTLEGVVGTMIDWNQGVEREAREKGKGNVDVQEPSVVPVGPNA